MYVLKMWCIKFKTVIFVFVFSLLERKVILEKTKHENKRALLFPASSTLGILIAIAVPLDLPNQNVFMSYNFEANYNLPFKGQHFIPGPLHRFESIDSERNAGRNNGKKIKKKSLMTRRYFYEILDNEFARNNYGGKSCLLRLICEVSAVGNRFGRHNGLFGDIFQILFTPYFSKQEESMTEYYKAQNFGLNDECKPYEKICSFCIFDFITTS